MRAGKIWRDHLARQPGATGQGEASLKYYSHEKTGLRMQAGFVFLG